MSLLVSPLRCRLAPLVWTFVCVLLIWPRAAVAQDSSVAHAAPCREWHECRQLALDALAQGEFERFHDYAWRTVQTGPPKNTELMYLLARAQSLSGRPHDALVMLERLAEMRVATDAATSDEFRAVRALKEWPELEARLRALAPPADEAVAAPPSVPSPPPAPAPALASPPPVPPTPAPSPVAEPIAGPAPVHGEEAVRIVDAGFRPRGLAYDAVSSRFVVADPSSRKLVILDERSRRAVDLVRASAAGFSDVAAFDIDARRGDLWVVSSGPAAEGDGVPPVSLLKLQLVSGRQLASFAVPPEFTAAQYSDVAVTPGGSVLMLDRLVSRIVVFSPSMQRFSALVMHDVPGATSVAPVDDRSVYVAHATGIAHVDLTTGRATPLRLDSARSRDAAASLDGFERIRWAEGRLVGIRRTADGAFAAARLKPGANGVTTEQMVEASAPIADATAVALSGSDLYVLTRSGPGQDAQIVVERFRLK